MKLMAIDCEMNQPSGKLIQIGAVAFDPLTGEILDRVAAYVNPGEQLNPEITTLTRITQEKVDGGLTPEQAYRLLKQFAETNKVFRNPVVWGSGDSNDAKEIYKQSGVQEENFMGHRVIDVKTICQIRSIVLKGDVAGGLREYLKRIGRQWDPKYGEPHDALADALNTVHCFMMYSEFMTAFTHIEKYHEQFAKPENKGKWQGVLKKLAVDIGAQIKCLAALQSLKDDLEGQN